LEETNSKTPGEGDISDNTEGDLTDDDQMKIYGRNLGRGGTIKSFITLENFVMEDPGVDRISESGIWVLPRLTEEMTNP